MALVEIQGFDHQDSATNLLANISTDNCPWTWMAVSGAIVSGRLGGKALALSGLFTGIKDTVFLDSTVILGCAIRVPTSVSMIVGVYDSLVHAPPNGQATILLDGSTGEISVYRGSTSGILVYSSGTDQFPRGGYFYLEVEVKVDSAIGTVDIQIGTVPYLSLTGLNIQGGATSRVDGLFLHSIGGRVDDLYIEDMTVGTGGNPFNTFQSDPNYPLGLRVFTRFPTVNGVEIDFTPLVPPNYSQVQEHAMDSDTSYNYIPGAVAAVCGSTTVQITTWDSSIIGANLTLSNSDLTVYGPDPPLITAHNASSVLATGSGKSSGKWYFAAHIDSAGSAVNSFVLGIGNNTSALDCYPGQVAACNSIGAYTGNVYLNGLTVGSFSGTGTYIVIAVDLDANLFWAGWTLNPCGPTTWSIVNGGVGSGNPAAGTNGISISAITGSILPIWGALNFVVGGAGQATLMTAMFFDQPDLVGFTLWDGGTPTSPSFPVPFDAKDLFEATVIPVGTIPLACKVHGAYRQTTDIPQIWAMLNKLRSGVTEFDGESKIINLTYRYQGDIYPENPDGNVPWTMTSINNSQIGYQIAESHVLQVVGQSNVSTAVDHSIPAVTFNLTTTSDDNVVIVVHVILNAEGAASIGQDQFAGEVLGVDCDGLSFVRRVRFTGQRIAGFLLGDTFVDSEVWWAYAPSILTSEPIIVNVNSELSWITCTAIAISGVDTSGIDPWDTNASLPAVASVLNGPSTQPEVTGVSTDSANSIVLWTLDEFTVVGLLEGPNGYSRGPGGQNVNAFIGLIIEDYTFYKTYDSVLNNETLTEVAGAAAASGPLTSWVIIADALRAA